jgi:hypothetical protein
MIKKILFISTFCFIAAIFSVQTCYSKETVGYYKFFKIDAGVTLLTDTVPPADVMDVIKKVIHSLDTFNSDEVADLYTPNAVIADDEPPYSWNGPTAGIQWVNAVEKVCKENELTKLKGNIEAINVCQQTVDNVYIVVPVSYVGNLPGRTRFSAKGAFTFVLRMENGKWLIKSQAWMPRKGM